MDERTKRRILGFCLFVAGLWIFFLNATFADSLLAINIAGGIVAGMGITLMVLPNLLRPR